MIDKEEILRQYLQWVEEVSEHLEDKTQFTPEEIVYRICQIIERNYVMIGECVNT